jgi:hypothetical protein
MRKTTMQQYHHHNNNNSLHHHHQMLDARNNHDTREMQIRTKCDGETDNTNLCCLKVMKTMIEGIGQASISNT